MNRTAAGLTTAVILVAASSLLVNPSLAQTQDWVPTGCTSDNVCSDVFRAAPSGPQAADSAPIGCSADFVCGDDPSVVSQWPLDRWLQVPRTPGRVNTTDAGPSAPRSDATATR